jgi:hypothetical protein
MFIAKIQNGNSKMEINILRGIFYQDSFNFATLNKLDVNIVIAAVTVNCFFTHARLKKERCNCIYAEGGFKSRILVEKKFP